MGNRYFITVSSAKNDAAPLNFEVDLLDDLHAIIERVRLMNLVPEEEAPAFGLGLKLFAESFLRHRRDPAFKEIATAFPAFMKQLKGRL
jgi:hypothetical protein